MACCDIDLPVTRTATAPEDLIEKDILRATQLRTTLMGAGVFWRSKGNYKRKEILWQCSFPCEQIRHFLSHAWIANGTLKYLACLLHSEEWLGTITFLSSFVLIYIMTVLGFFPIIGHSEWMISNTTYVVPLSFGCAFWPPALALLAMFVSPSLPCLYRNAPVFLDMLCINQVDKELKTQGIQSLAGFLANSEEFLVLWSEHYFKRLWCVFEVAAFRHHRPKGKITIRPTSLVFARFLGFVSSWIISNLWLYVLVVSSDNAYDYAALLIWIPSVVGLGVTQKLLRALMRDKFALRGQLLGFDCGKAACFDPSDREFILSSIRRWFGTEDSFNTYVRGPMREMLESKMFARPVDYYAAFLAALPISCNALEFVAGGHRAGMPWGDLLLAILSLACNQFCLWPLAVWSVYILAERFCMLRKLCVAEVALNAALSAGTILVFGALFSVGSVLLSGASLIQFFVYEAFVISLTWLAFNTYPKIRGRNIDTWFSMFRDGATILGAPSDGSKEHQTSMTGADIELEKGGENFEDLPHGTTLLGAPSDVSTEHQTSMGETMDIDLENFSESVEDIPSVEMLEMLEPTSTLRCSAETSGRVETLPARFSL